MKTKRVQELTLSDTWLRKGLPCQVLAIGFMENPGIKPKPGTPIRIAYRDGYTPPEDFKEDRYSWDDVVQVKEEGEG